MKMREKIKRDETAGGISLKCGAVVFGNGVNTDLIHAPAEFSINTAKLRSGLVRSKFRAGVLKGGGLEGGDALSASDKILLAGENFGLGSSRFSTVAALGNEGVRCVAALSLARIFERNLASVGIFPLTICGNDNIRFKEYIAAGICAAAGVIIYPPEAGSDSASASLELDSGGGKTVLFEAYVPSLLYAVAAAGGMVGYIAGN